MQMAAPTYSLERQGRALPCGSLTESKFVFQMQLAKKRDAAPSVRDYMTDVQRRYTEIETGRGIHRDS
jgi:hypothetical protein